MTTASYTLHDQELMARARNYFAWQSQMVLRHTGRRIVEIGCGIGNFTGMLLDRDAVLALDIEPACVERLKSRFPNKTNLRTEVCDWAVAETCDLADFQPDTCICLNVLEHLADDRGALQRMAAILKPGGVAILIVPAFPALYGPIDHLLGHYRRYTRKSLRTLAAACGLQVQTLQFMNAIGFFGWWANARIFRRTVQSERQIEVFDRLIVPFSSRLESLLPPPFGQSLLAVLRKP